MSYCVNCGVELGEGTRVCPLCGTEVLNPRDPCPKAETPFFPTRQEPVNPVPKKGLAVLLSSMFASVAICCGLLNLVLAREKPWWLYVAGAAVMLWIFFVVPLLWRKIPAPIRAFVNICAVAFYVLLIALACEGMEWYRSLALPILGATAVLGLVVSGVLRKKKHSLLTSLVVLLLALGLQCGAIEIFTDLYLLGRWVPGWSLVVLTVCLGLSVPLIVVRAVPSLREQARRIFHT